MGVDDDSVGPEQHRIATETNDIRLQLGQDGHVYVLESVAHVNCGCDRCDAGVAAFGEFVLQLNHLLGQWLEVEQHQLYLSFRA